MDCRDASDEADCTSDVDFENTYYPEQLPTRCPNSTGLIGVCSEDCSSDDPCDDDNLLCCSNGCGHSCMVGQTVAPLCPALARQQYGAIGAFVPQCERDGSFSEVQCWGSTGYCWCVETTSGRPIGEGMRGRPECTGQHTCMHTHTMYTYTCTHTHHHSVSIPTGCTVDDIVYPYGERFTADDGCNTWYKISFLLLNFA